MTRTISSRTTTTDDKVLCPKGWLDHPWTTTTTTHVMLEPWSSSSHPDRTHQPHYPMLELAKHLQACHYHHHTEEETLFDDKTEDCHVAEAVMMSMLAEDEQATDARVKKRIEEDLSSQRQESRAGAGAKLDDNSVVWGTTTFMSSAERQRRVDNRELARTIDVTAGEMPYKRKRRLNQARGPSVVIPRKKLSPIRGKYKFHVTVCES